MGGCARTNCPGSAPRRPWALAALATTRGYPLGFCSRASVNAGGILLFILFIARGEAYKGEVLTPEGEFESATGLASPAPVVRRTDAIVLLRSIATADPVLAAGGGVQTSDRGTPTEVDGRTVLEVTSRYGANGQVDAVVDCTSGLVRKLTWRSYG